MVDVMRKMFVRRRQSVVMKYAYLGCENFQRIGNFMQNVVFKTWLEDNKVGIMMNELSAHDVVKVCKINDIVIRVNLCMEGKYWKYSANVL